MNRWAIICYRHVCQQLAVAGRRVGDVRDQLSSTLAWGLPEDADAFKGIAGRFTPLADNHLIEADEVIVFRIPGS